MKKLKFGKNVCGLFKFMQLITKTHSDLLIPHPLLFSLEHERPEHLGKATNFEKKSIKSKRDDVFHPQFCQGLVFKYMLEGCTSDF